MDGIIQASKRVDDVRAQHWVNILNKKFAVTRSVICSPSVYVANDNFVVRVIDICTRKSKNEFIHNTRPDIFIEITNMVMSEEKAD
jgi:ABC-type Na+ transport system ATPase subunit NatA